MPVQCGFHSGISAWARRAAKRPPLCGLPLTRWATRQPLQGQGLFRRSELTLGGPLLPCALGCKTGAGRGGGGVAPAPWHGGFPGYPPALQTQCCSPVFRLPPPRPGLLPGTLHPANRLSICSQLHEPGLRHHAVCTHALKTPAAQHTPARMHPRRGPATRSGTRTLSRLHADAPPSGLRRGVCAWG